MNTQRDLIEGLLQFVTLVESERKLLAADLHDQTLSELRELARLARRLFEKPEGAMSLVVLDIKMPELSGVKVARQIWSEMKLARIIFWSQYKDEIYVRELARIVPGETVYGYVLKSSPDEKLIAALRAVLVDEQCWIDPEIRTVQSRATNRASGLTDIEYEALIDIALGLTDKAIARRRYLSERGVQNRLRELYAKLSIDIEQIVDERWSNTYSPRSRAISIAMQRGLINADELARENEALQEWLQRENAIPT